MRRAIPFLAVAGLLVLTAATSASRPSATAGHADAALDDANIVAIFDAANTADIQTGDLAAKKGSTKEVRDLGAMFARDHRQVRQQGRDLAKKLGVTPVPPAGDHSAADAASVLADLKTRSGSDFDKAYLAHEVEYHKAVIDAVNQTLLPAIQNAELKALVIKVAPAFQAHMLAAENLQKKLAAE